MVLANKRPWLKHINLGSHVVVAQIANYILTQNYILLLYANL